MSMPLPVVCHIQRFYLRQVSSTNSLPVRDFRLGLKLSALRGLHIQRLQPLCSLQEITAMVGQAQYRLLSDWTGVKG